MDEKEEEEAREGSDSFELALFDYFVMIIITVIIIIITQDLHLKL